MNSTISRAIYLGSKLNAISDFKKIVIHPALKACRFHDAGQTVPKYLTDAVEDKLSALGEKQEGAEIFSKREAMHHSLSLVGRKSDDLKPCRSLNS